MCILLWLLFDLGLRVLCFLVCVVGCFRLAGGAFAVCVGVGWWVMLFVVMDLLGGCFG